LHRKHMRGGGRQEGGSTDATPGPIRIKDRAVGFSGKLRNFPLLDIIQMACVARRDGRLRVRRRGETGEIVLQDGRIIHAVTKSKTGEPALLEVLCWIRGIFEFVPIAPEQVTPRTIFGRWEEVLMDAVRQRDEWEHHGVGQERNSRMWSRSFLSALRPAPKRWRVNDRSEKDGKETGPQPEQDVVTELLQRIAKEQDRERRHQTLKQTISLGLIVAVSCAVLSLLLDQGFRLLVWETLIDMKIPQAFGLQTHWQKLTPARVLIPAGPFLFQDDRQVDMPAFNIDSTEVTVWQYQEFLNALGDDTRYDHPNQRVGKGHTNPKWEAYAKAAFAGAEFKGVRLNPNFPAVYLDWFDAYAFAKWQHRRLPSEMEWEKAGRGNDGRQYPWGDEPKTGAANLYTGARRTGGWSEVGQYPVDSSPYGVRDLAGNVSEWTASDDGSGSPVVRGGNFMSEDGQLTRRVVGLSPYTLDERIGFRTAGDIIGR
jgi:formylglycine-generating enzyme required for sulfatase activity